MRRWLPVTVALAMSTAVVAVPRSAHACSDADQKLRHVLGRSGNDLIVLSLDVSRADVDEPNGLSVRWRGRARLELLPPIGDARVHLDLGSVDVPARSDQYGKSLAPLYRRALREAAKLPTFESVKRTRYRHCSGQSRCGRVALSVDKGALTVRDGSTRRVVQPPGELVEHLLARAGIESDKASPKEVEAVLKELGIIHLFRYQIGRRQHLVVNVGAGGEKHAWPILRSWPPRGCAGLAQCPPATRTLHHGFQMDLVLR